MVGVGRMALAGKLRQPLAFGCEHLGGHVPDLFEGQHGAGQGIEGAGMDDVLGIACQGGFDGQALDVDVGQVEGGALGRQIADDGLVQTGAVNVNRTFGAAIDGQIGDHPAIDQVAVELEGAAGLEGFDDIRAIFDAAGRQGQRLGIEQHLVLVFIGHVLTKVVIGAALAAKAWFVAVKIEGFLVLAEPGHVFRQVTGGFGHEITEMAEDLAAHFLVDVVFGLLEALAQEGVEVLPGMFELEEPAHVIDAGAQEVDLSLRLVDVAGDQVEGGLDAVAQADKRQL